MNVIELAKEAGFDEHHATYDLRIKAFAALIRAEVESEWIETNKALAKEIIEQRNQYLDKLVEAIDLSVKAEREACAKVCDERERANLYGVKECAAAIRARGKK